MFDEMDDDNAAKLKYLIAMGVAFVIFLVITLFTMDTVKPGGKKKSGSESTAKPRV
jgi:hypothetical protein